MWSRTEDWHGSTFVWNMLHQFGGRSGMFGQLERVARGPAEALRHNRTTAAVGGSGRSAGQMRGLGLTPEAIETDPMVYELMLENVWRNDEEQPMDDAALLSWVQRYARRRLGSRAPRGVEHAYVLLARSVYAYKEQKRAKQGPSGSVLAARPALRIDAVSCCDNTELWYNTTDVVAAWRIRRMCTCAATASGACGRAPPHLLLRRWRLLRSGRHRRRLICTHRESSSSLRTSF